MSGGIEVKRALISVSDKEGLEDLAKELSSLDIDILSTGGTKKFIEGIGVNVTDASVTFTPIPSINFFVPPVDRISISNDDNSLAKSSKPSLSETDISALLTSIPPLIKLTPRS